MYQIKYPQINIKTKNELVKRIGDKKLPYQENLAIFNEVLLNTEKHWKDSKSSDKTKGKYVRTAYNTPLGKVLKLIDRKILAVNDHLLPSYIYGGVSHKDHITAVTNLLGTKRKRTLFTLDISLFFEQTSEDRVYHFFHNKAGCTIKTAKYLSKLCCVTKGAKGSNNNQKVLARGFATSTRLAIWCNLNLFNQLNFLIKKRLDGYDPRLSIFIDDIGISASRVPLNIMEKLKIEVIGILANADKNQSLPINTDKTKITDYTKTIEHLGLKLWRNHLSFGRKTQSRKSNTLNQLRSNSITTKEKNLLIKKKKAYVLYAQRLKNNS